MPRRRNPNDLSGMVDPPPPARLNGVVKPKPAAMDPATGYEPGYGPTDMQCPDCHYLYAGPHQGEDPGRVIYGTSHGAADECPHCKGNTWFDRLRQQMQEREAKRKAGQNPDETD